MLMLQHFPLIFSISHPYTHAINGFHTKGCSFTQLTILTPMKTFAYESFPFEIDIALLNSNLQYCNFSTQVFHLNILLSHKIITNSQWPIISLNLIWVIFHHRNSTELNELQNSAPESGSEMSDMVSSNELGIEVESLENENNQDPPVLTEAQPPSSQKPNLKSYEKEKTVEPCAPKEDAVQYHIILSGKAVIKSEENIFSKITQTNPMLEKIENDSEIPDYVPQNIGEAISLLKMYLKHKSITNWI
ncbi:hypothetical protein O181_074346 [Austropuccinia psidii MF-1]|uniref:Uncharacterized protein n=1 Tax=Austropuccinia psidii MF-1 TaxID=1389203 RepID=A0A9Q3F6D9_9BASI|nr:hypothetical protein [Austropuccinia psidii MF-1]